MILLSIFKSTFYLKDMIRALTSKFEWTLDKIRIEEIITAPVWATTFFC